MKEKATNWSRQAVYYIRVAPALALLLIFILIVFTMLFNVSRENVLSIGHLNAMQASQDIKYYMIEEIDVIALASETIEEMQEAGDSNEEILEYFKFQSKIVTETINENYTGLYGYVNGHYMDGSGWIPEAGYDPKSRPWYQAAIKGGGTVVYVTPYVDAETGTVMMSISKMLHDKKSVVSLDVSMDRIQEIVESKYSMDYDQIIVTDKANIVVASLDKSLLGKTITDDPLIKAYADSDTSTNAYGNYRYRGDSGKKFTVFTSDVEDQWNVYLSVKSSKLLSSFHNIYVILIVGMLAFIALLLSIFDYLNKRRKAAEALNNQLESIADIYISVHKFDIANDAIEEIRSMPYVREQIRLIEKTATNSYEILEGVMKVLVRDEHWEDMMEFINLDTLDLRVGSSNTITREFLGIHGWAKARIVILERKNDRITSFLWMVENIDEEKRKQNELRYLSETDLMTGIKNRGSGEKLIKEQLKNRAAGMFCLIDADKLKSINDTYGHDVGDEVIRAIANQLSRSFRSSDIVLRLGGDEFAAFAVGIEDEVHANEVLNRFVTAVEQINIPAFNGERVIEISIGATFVSPDSTHDFKSLYKEADTALYKSKDVSRSCVTFYREDM